MHIHNYQSAADYLGRKTDRPLPGRASRLIRRSDINIAVRYQATDVVTYHHDGTLTLNSDGWQTSTTKARMCEYSPVRLFQDRSIWYIAGNGEHGWDIPRHERMLYFDGMRITAEGLPAEPRYSTKTDSDIKRKLDKLVSMYIKGYAEHITTHGLDNPSNGDCWGCLMQVKDDTSARLAPHGRIEFMGVDHYLSHFEERYYVPSLLWNAISARGYREPALIWHMIAGRKDSSLAADILRAYFKKLKPALLKEASHAGT